MCRGLPPVIYGRSAMEVDDRIKKTVAERREKESAESEMILDNAKSYLTGRYKTIQTITRSGDRLPRYLRS
jgi:F420-0:gamma-glutamyl ligase